MHPYIVFFNELCVENITQNLAPEQWQEAVSIFSVTASKLLPLRRDLKIGFLHGTLNHDCHGTSLLDSLRSRMRRDAYLLLLKRTEHFGNDDLPLLTDALFEKKSGKGILLAAKSSLSTSFGCTVSLDTGATWKQDTLVVCCSELEEGSTDLIESEISLAHISCNDHVAKWENKLIDWGKTIATSWKIFEFHGMPIVMYPGPKEHPPAHIHLLDANGSGNTIAKYEILNFSRAKGPPTWDAEIEHFINTHRADLLRSWKRCQAGEKPISIR